MHIGTDAVEIIKTKCKEKLKVIKEWSDFSKSKDFPGPTQGFSAEEEKMKASLGM